MLGLDATFAFAHAVFLAYLRLHGVQAKEHHVFRELTRVKQYFEKIKEAESEPTKNQQGLTLDKEAAGRFIKHALVNYTYLRHLLQSC